MPPRTARPRSPRAIAFAAMALQTLLASATYPIAKAALLEVPPLTLAALRFAGAALAFGAILAIRREGAPSRAALPRLALLGFFGVPANQLLFFIGMNWTTPAHAALLYALTPVAVIVLERVLLGSPLTPRKALGVAFALGGTIVVLTRPGHGLALRPLEGDLVLFVAMLGWALYSVLGKPAVDRHGAVFVSGWSILLGTLFVSPLVGPALVRSDLRSIPPIGWAGAAYLALGTSVACYGLYLFALRRLNPTAVAVFANLQPPTAAALSALFLGERISVALVFGGGLVLSGIALASAPAARAGSKTVEDP